MSDRRRPAGPPRRVPDLRGLVCSVIFVTAALLLAGGPSAAFAQLPPGEVLVVDEHAGPGLLGALFRVNPVTGNRTVLSDFSNRAQGPLGEDPSGVALEASGAIIVSDRVAGTANRGSLFRVDPATGNRALFTDFGNLAQGPLGSGPFGVAVEASGAILAANVSGGTNFAGSLFRVDPATGNRTLLSDFGNPAQGPQGNNTFGVALQASGGILVISHNSGPVGLGQLFRVDPVTGNRALLSDFGNPAQGPLGTDPIGVALEASGAILVIDFGALGPARGKPNVNMGMLFRADPVTGYRNLLSDLGAAAQGPLGTDPFGVAVEASGAILVTDAEAGRGGMGVLFRVDPVFGKRTLLSDFGNAAQGPLGLSPLGVAVVPTVRQAVAGCIDADGNPLRGAKVRLTQPRETAQTTTTDAEGCYLFGTAVSGKKGKVSITLPVFP